MIQLNHATRPESPQSLSVRILSTLIRQRNPTLTVSEARERAIAAVVGALAHREPQPQGASHV